MTTHAAHWDDAFAGPRPARPVLGGMAVALRNFWSRRKTRMILSDMEDHMLRDIGIDPHSVRPRTAQTAGWVVEAQARMPGLVFLGH
jgi:uncharacterized protein YjiS (DUF1127 family)